MYETKSEAAALTGIAHLGRKHSVFAVCCAVLALISWQSLRQLYAFSLDHEFASMIPIMPVMSAVLIYRSRKRIFEGARSSPYLGGIFLLIGGAVLIMAGPDIRMKASGIVALIFAAFLLCYGKNCFKNGLLPLLMLLFMIPIPDAWLAASIQALQKGSAEGVAILFKLTDTPYHREGLMFLLPKTTIEIAPQCSSIRSSLALLISGLLAGHLILRTTSRKLILALVIVPLAMVKNAIRIVTLSLLAIQVDMGYLAGGDLHRRGGIVFFVLALLLMWPILWILRKTEKAATNYDS